jgi:beta-lactamase regulating signal transducer with metallopeptidase domain
MDLRLAFITASLMALATIMVRAVFGKRVAWIIAFIGALSLLLPLILTVVFGAMGMLSADRETSGRVSSETITAILNYEAENLPVLVIAAIAGAIMGFVLSLVKKATPRRVRSKVRRAIRL